jgi:murein L,D-transpeptidase YcbB/YkuD
MTRRLLLLAAVSALPARSADPARDAASVLTELAAALTAGNVQEFLAPFDRSFPDYERLRVNVSALVDQGETQSYLDVVANDGDAARRTLEVEWELRIRRMADATISARRQVRVACTLELRGKRWRILRFKPVDFLAP